MTTSLFSKFSLEKLRFLPRKKKGIFKFGSFSLEYVDPLSFYYGYKDIFENRIYHFRSSNPSPVIIDVGGYIGISVLYFKSIYPKAKIIAFEPNPNLFRVFRRNVKNNKLENTVLINAGLGKTNRIVDFYANGADGGSIFNINNHKVEKIKVKVKMVKLSEYINIPVDLLKMNIEGGEGDVFEEIEDKLHFVKQIIFEYHAFYNLPQNLGKILEILNKHGFRYIVTDATNAKIPIPFNLPGNYRYFNLIYAKQI